MPHQILQRFRIHPRTGHIAAVGMPANVWSNVWHLNPVNIIVSAYHTVEPVFPVHGLENPNSVVQMKGWLSDNGVQAESLDKKAVKELISDSEDRIADVLSYRQQLAKSSVSKYTAMQNAVCADVRARGMFQFYGANRSGRWAGRLIQLQNLPQNHMDDLEEARNLVRDGNFSALEMLYDNIPNVLSELIRTAFIPKPGYKYIVSDFSAIEARVLSFLAGEQWRVDVFKAGKRIGITDVRRACPEKWPQRASPAKGQNRRIGT